MDNNKVDDIMKIWEKPNFRAFLGQKSTKNPFLSHFLVKTDGAMAPEVEHKYKYHVYIEIFEIWQCYDSVQLKNMQK